MLTNFTLSRSNNVLFEFGLFYRSPLLQALIGLFELPKDDSTHPDDHFIEVDDTPGYTVAYSQLTFANKQEHDPLGGLSNCSVLH